MEGSTHRLRSRDDGCGSCRCRSRRCTTRSVLALDLGLLERLCDLGPPQIIHSLQLSSQRSLADNLHERTQRFGSSDTDGFTRVFEGLEEDFDEGDEVGFRRGRGGRLEGSEVELDRLGFHRRVLVLCIRHDVLCEISDRALETMGSGLGSTRDEMGLTEA